MQGYIISVNRARDEDVVVTILTAERLLTLYRFYGARHSTINLGYKVDFEVETDSKSTISRLRNILHLGFPWLVQPNRQLIWQQFCKLLHNHLRDNETVEPFYFELLETSALLWEHQNPKRIAIEAYTKLLNFEGRLHKEQECYLCELPLLEDPALIRAFLPTHTKCSYTKSFPLKSVQKLFEEHTSILFSDEEVERLYQIVVEGF